MGSQSGFVDNDYLPDERWYDQKGRPFQPGEHYNVGGKTKFYGAALFRLRETDFSAVKHYGGISPSWPLQYNDFKDYYMRAEQLFQVHGQRGIDPTEPPETRSYPYPAVSNEPRIQQIYDNLRKNGIHAAPLPLGLRLLEQDKINSPCIRCDTCDGFACLVHAKSDAEMMCVRPALQYSNVTLLTNAKATKLITNASGKTVVAVEVEHNNEKITVTADLFCVSCGAINSAALLLRSANQQHPNGLANSSDCVGRNYMCHINSIVIAVSEEKNLSAYDKTIVINDFYHNAPDAKYPLGSMQLIGSVKKEMLLGQIPRLTRLFMRGTLQDVAEHAVGWWLTTEDLPTAKQRVTLNANNDIVLHYAPNNMVAHKRLYQKLKYINKNHCATKHLFKSKLYLHDEMSISGVAHQAGTCRFGTDPKTSVLDLYCKSHDCDNLYVVDTSFFPSVGAVNPSLTAIANAIRVADHLKERL